MSNDEMPERVWVSREETCEGKVVGHALILREEKLHLYHPDNVTRYVRHDLAGGVGPSILRRVADDHPHVKYVDGVLSGVTPLVNGTRFSVFHLLGKLALGMSVEEIKSTWNLTDEMVQDALGYTQDVIGVLLDQDHESATPAPVSEAGSQDVTRLRWLLTQILFDLPAKRDWLDPAIEAEARSLTGVQRRTTPSTVAPQDAAVQAAREIAERWRDGLLPQSAAIHSLRHLQLRELAQHVITRHLPSPVVRDAERPRIVCLCGSTRFIELFAIKTWELEREGNIVLGCTLLPMWYCNTPSHFGEATGTKEQCDELHKRKIDLADEVFVLNVGGYIGESTRNEIEYAKARGKPVSYLEPVGSAPSGRPEEQG